MYILSERSCYTISAVASIALLLPIQYIQSFPLAVFQTPQRKRLPNLITRHQQLSASKADPSAPKNERKNKKRLTLGELSEQILKNPSKLQEANDKKRKKGSRRTRSRVENPKQQYIYASQRKALAKKKTSVHKSSSDGDESNNNELITDQTRRASLIAQAKEFGLVGAAQHCDPIVDLKEPEIVGQIRVGEGTTSGSYAYLIEKPAGWCILGSGRTAKSKKISQQRQEPEETGQKKSKKNFIKKVKVENEDGSFDFLEYNEFDVVALMTPEELEELTPEEREELPALPKGNQMISDSSVSPPSSTDNEIVADSTQMIGKETMSHEKTRDINSMAAENLRKIAARQSTQVSEKVCFDETATRPSVVAWLKEYKAATGSPIRGGKFWTAVAGSASVDDSGLVLLCPKEQVDNVFVDYIEYVAAIGTGGHLAPNPKESKKIISESVKIDLESKLRKGRGDDAVQVARIMIPEALSTCNSVVGPCQEQFQDGIRGDPAANPFDRRAARRLIHCNAMSVSSLLWDETVEAEAKGLPDDIALLAQRRNQLMYKQGSFLGRSALRKNTMTTAYREINGEADGFPGWTVDRYGKFLLVQHNKDFPRGPLPSIHDGNTAGIYLLESNPDRSSMGAQTGVRPQLIEGQPAPEFLTIMENGVSYVVSLEKDLSTGIFLDQRPHRAWLTRHCSQDTRVLNCFAHTGAFSVAAAKAGAATVSLDLSQKWLDRFPAHLKANGIDFDERHDCIYGDCFDWLTRLSKRGEKFDLVILDPPSTSVGGRKKKRWSVKNDMDQLTALAAGLVKKGGLLWTTTNSASIHPIKFASLCQKGLEDAGIDSAKLECVRPMPVDFPVVGPQSVKNLVWRL